jgi:TIR domain-containing protein
MTDAGAPKVFISHASEDKAFVLDFAARLRARGIDAWLDRWEILPGDSFVRKIFDEGLGQAKAVIVVISKASADKPWVREELDVAVVRKINRASKLIPVIIDDSRVPNCLQATLWERIADLKSYDESLNRIVSAIFGQTDKPPIGEQPAYARKDVIPIGDLTSGDSLVLQAACEMCLEGQYDNWFIQPDELFTRTDRLGISREAVEDSVDILGSRGYLRRVDYSLCLEDAGLEEYLKAHRPDYPDLLKKLAANIVNNGMSKGEDIEAAMKLPPVLLRRMVDGFEERKWLVVSRYGGGGWEVAEGRLAAEMKRWLAS